MPRFPAKTSLEILTERDALRARVDVLEAAFEVVRGEVELAMRHPEVHVGALCRIETVVRRMLDARTRTAGDAPDPPSSGTSVRDDAASKNEDRAASRAR